MWGAGQPLGVKCSGGKCWFPAWEGAGYPGQHRFDLRLENLEEGGIQLASACWVCYSLWVVPWVGPASFNSHECALVLDLPGLRLAGLLAMLSVRGSRRGWCQGRV